MWWKTKIAIDNYDEDAVAVVFAKESHSIAVQAVTRSCMQMLGVKYVWISIRFASHLICNLNNKCTSISNQISIVGCLIHQIIDRFERRVTWFLFIQKKEEVRKNDEYCSVGVWSGDMPWFGSSGLGLCANPWEWHENFQIHHIFIDSNRRPVFANSTQSTKNGERTQCNPDYRMWFRIGVNRNLYVLYRPNSFGHLTNWITCHFSFIAFFPQIQYGSLL